MSKNNFKSLESSLIEVLKKYLTLQIKFIFKAKLFPTCTCFLILNRPEEIWFLRLICNFRLTKYGRLFLILLYLCTSCKHADKSVIKYKHYYVE